MITQLIMLAKDHDYSIEFNSKSRKMIKDDQKISGYIDHYNRRILINKLKDQQMIIYHLCHELGHMMSRESKKYVSWDKRFSSELIAHYFGWKIIREYHIDISRNSWKMYYRKSIKEKK